MSKDNIKKLLREVIVSFEGVDYDIPDNELASIKNRLEFGSANPTPENSRVFNTEKAKIKLKGVMGEKYLEANAKINAYKSNTRSQIFKVLANNPASFAQTVFSVVPSIGLRKTMPPEWIEMIDTHRPGRSNAVGRGEIALSLFLQGVIPDSGSGTHDLNIPQLGGESGSSEFHVKEVASSGGLKRPDVPMGKNISGTDKQEPWAQSLFDTTPFDGKAITETMIKASGKAILDKFASIQGLPAPKTVEDYSKLADAWQNNFTESFLKTESWGGAAGLIFISRASGEFLIAGPKDCVPSRISDNKWRVSTKAAMGSRWSNYFKRYVPDQITESSSLEISLLKNLIRESLIQEELTKSDKKEIDKLIKKAIEKDRAEQKKIIRKEIEDELVKSLGKSFFRQPGRIRKTIIDVCQEELAKEMQKGSKMEKSVVDVTKKVMTAWHEMLYKQKHIVDRIKV